MFGFLFLCKLNAEMLLMKLCTHCIIGKIINSKNVCDLFYRWQKLLRSPHRNI